MNEIGRRQKEKFEEDASSNDAEDAGEQIWGVRGQKGREKGGILDSTRHELEVSLARQEKIRGHEREVEGRVEEAVEKR